MRRLILLRHAKTEVDSATGKDHDRRLDARGHEDAAVIGEYLAAQSQKPDLTLVSTATRAQQTWAHILAAIPDAPALSVDELYSAGPSTILEIIKSQDTGDLQTLMIVAHNPGLHELGLCLVGNGGAAAIDRLTSNLPTGGLLTLDFQIDRWDDIAFRTARLESFVTPKLLRDTAKATRSP